tara:strand:- start:305 stop:787 length:483 start_codon:yes stop_codon:yes gene_type:complete
MRKKTTDTAGPKGYKRKTGRKAGQRRFFQGLEGSKIVPRMGHMLRDPKTGKEMSGRQFVDLVQKEDFDAELAENKGNRPRIGSTKQQKALRGRIEDRSVFDHHMKDKSLLKKAVGNVKRAFGKSGLKYGGKVKPYGMKRGGSPVCRGMGTATRGGKYKTT